MNALGSLCLRWEAELFAITTYIAFTLGLSVIGAGVWSIWDAIVRYRGQRG